MSNLAKKLQKYYKREGLRIIFNNGQSLNQLAITMWELLGYQQIDASVLSRVLKGERLFTGSQLKVFCKALDISADDEKELLQCLVNDHHVKKDLHTDTVIMPSSMAFEVLEDLLEHSFKTLFEGNCAELENKCNFIDTFIGSSMTNQPDEKLDMVIALNLYLKGRAIGSTGLHTTVIKETVAIAGKLLEISKKHNNKIIYGYANTLLSNAYYVAGGYSISANKSKLYKKSIDYGRNALESLQDDNSEKLFALRTMVASAIYLKDHEVILYAYNKTREILPMQPLDNRVNALHLCGTLSNGLAVLNKANPFSIKESAIEYFQSDLSNTGIYEISDIKAELDTLLVLKTGDKTHITNRIKKGIAIADKNNFTRHKSYLENLFQNV